MSCSKLKTDYDMLTAHQRVLAERLPLALSGQMVIQKARDPVPKVETIIAAMSKEFKHDLLRREWFAFKHGYAYVGEFSDGWAPVRKTADGPFYYVDEQAKRMNDQEFKVASPFTNGLAVVGRIQHVPLSRSGGGSMDTEEYEIIDRTGARVNEKDFAYIMPFTDTVTWAEEVTDSGATIWKIINQSGEPVQSFGAFVSGVLPFQKGIGYYNRWGSTWVAVGIDGKEAGLSPEENVFIDGIAIKKNSARHSGEPSFYTYILENDELLVNRVFAEANRHVDGIACVAEWANKSYFIHEYYFIDAHGQQLFNKKFTEVESFSGGVARVRDSLVSDWYYIDRYGNRVFSK